MKFKVGDLVLPRVRGFRGGYPWGVVGYLKKDRVYQIQEAAFNSYKIIDLETGEKFYWFDDEGVRKVPKTQLKGKLEDLL